MVALLSPSQLSPSHLSTTQLSPKQLSPGERRSVTGVSGVASRPRHLHLVKTKPASAVDPLSLAAVIGVIIMVLLVVLVRGVQGAPPATDWASLAAQSTPTATATATATADGNGAVQATANGTESVVGRTDHTVTVAAGDTWASIAAAVAPGADPVEFARLGASVNGGYQLSVGQVIVLPMVD